MGHVEQDGEGGVTTFAVPWIRHRPLLDAKHIPNTISRISSASLVCCPAYPNSISWSEENLVAVAAGKLVTVLNPILPSGPRGFIVLPSDSPFPVGVVAKKDLRSASLFSDCLRNNIPCARSISWSPIGFAPGGGSLLAVCTVEGRVKVYASAVAQLRSEWTEVVDISDLLCEYFLESGFVEPTMWNQHIRATVNLRKDRGNSADCLPLIPTKDFAYRIRLVSTLVVAWSPKLHSLAEDEFYPKCSVLAIGGKGGHLSFWRFQECQLENSIVSECFVVPMTVELIQAHSSWITAISLELCSTCATMPQLFVASGSSDGSVKLWFGDVNQLVSSKFGNNACFVLFKEILPPDHVPISSISLVALKAQPDTLLLAVGKGSGIVEAWTLHILNRGVVSVGRFDAHDKVVTGLAWAFDGGCLYSCSQDCCLRAWTLRGDSLQELLCQQLSDPCFGLVFSPAKLMLSVVHELDSSLLNPMYEAKTQKAAVELFWMAGLQLKKQQSYNVCTDHKLSECDLIFWESSLLWSLKQFENVDMELVVWDVLAALSNLRESSPRVLETVLCRLFSSWCSSVVGMSSENIIPCISHSLSTMGTRKLHLLNIICRRLCINEPSECRSNGLGDGLNEDINKWEDILVRSERELLERLVAFSFKVFLHNSSAMINDNCWRPLGVAQMNQWVASEYELISNKLKDLASNIQRIDSKLHSIHGYEPMEHCVYCSAVVPFEHTDIAFCSGKASTQNNLERCTLVHCSSLNKDGEGKNNIVLKHKLSRCSASMRLCHSMPVWFCKCCKRCTNAFVPEIFFRFSVSPLDDKFKILSSHLMKPSKPLCPYCGVLLHKSMPQFLISASPV